MKTGVTIIIILLALSQSIYNTTNLKSLEQTRSEVTLIDQNIQEQTVLLQEYNKLLKENNLLLAQYYDDLCKIMTKIDKIILEINNINSLNTSQETDITNLTTSLMGFKEVWDELNFDRFTATAYSPFDNVSGIENDGDPTNTATGTYPDWGTFAVCPDTIPYYSEVTVIGKDYIEHGVALDTGGTMRKYGTWIDLYRDTYLQTLEFGLQRDVLVLWKEP
jgi:3D (Asp-Asp-Asp) domain-containing protein